MLSLSRKTEGCKTLSRKSNRAYTEEQLKLETWSRWNGGSYHIWDETAKTWKRNDEIMCDSKTGNIGWDITIVDNMGKTESQLRKRDKDTYSNPKKNKTAGNKWKYTGICYAGHLNQE